MHDTIKRQESRFWFIIILTKTMSNIIRTSSSATSEDTLSMSNQGTDCFFELLINAASGNMNTDSQKRMIAFLDEKREENRFASGTASFDIDEMPWDDSSLQEDSAYMISVIRKAKDPSSWTGLGYKPNKEILIPWFDKFEDMIRKETKEMMRGFRVISNQVRFGCGYRIYDGRKQYFAWHGYPSRNDDYFTTSEISKEEYDRINEEYPEEIIADRETAELFRNRYVNGHPVIMEGWNKLP